jgi:hypothetical protein
VRLTADRLELLFRDQIRGVLLVSLLTSDDAVRELLEDLAFEAVAVFAEKPDAWRFGGDVPESRMERRVWFEATSRDHQSLRRDLTPDVRIVRAWDALEDAPHAPSAPVAPPPSRVRVCLSHPYATTACGPARFIFVHVFGVAYPLVGSP